MYEADLTLVEQYEGEEELIEDLEDEAIEYKEDKVQEQNPIEQSLEVVEFIKDFEQDINLIIAKGLEHDLFEESSIWTKKSQNHILEEEERLGGFQKVFLKRLFDYLSLFRNILYLLDPVPIRFTTYFWRTMWHMLGIKVKFLATYHPQAYDHRTKLNPKDLSR